MSSEIKSTVEVDFDWVVGLFNYIDPPPMTRSDGSTLVFKNPNAAEVLALLSAHIRNFKAVPKSAAIHDSSLAEKVTVTGMIATRDAIISTLRYELEELKGFVELAYVAHPNLDLDVESVRKNDL